MLILFALALIIAVLACVFALQNAYTITITFLTFKYEASLALILLGTFGMGAVVALLASLPAMIKGKMIVSELRHKIKNLEKTPSPSSLRDTPPA